MKGLFKALKSDQGFTYLDVIVAFILFGMMFVFVVRISNSVYTLNRVSQLENRMVHIAELQYENYKSGINNLGTFLVLTGFAIEEETYDVDNDLVSRRLHLSQLDDRFDVVLDEVVVNANVSEVLIEVTDRLSDANSANLTGLIIKDTP